ncbi:MAG: class I SAM-dependent methyltransferase [Gemmataceae bacterium]
MLHPSLLSSSANAFVLSLKRPYRYVRHHLQEWWRRVHWRYHGLKWVVATDKVSGSDVEISGWALIPPWRRQEITFTCNGVPFAEVEYPIPRSDVAQSFPHAPWAVMSGFICRTKLPAPLPPGGKLTFECVLARSGRRLLPTYYPQYFRAAAPSDPPLPDAIRRERVTTQNSPDVFVREGFIHFERLQEACRKVTGQGFEGRQNILDWGCGSGRLSRYLSDRTPATFTGVDVDPHNVQWCRAHLPFGRFESINLHPPTMFADGEFDLVIGLSVFTHLREADQFEWLEELRRVTRPGAILLLTIHGEAHFWIMPATLPPELEQKRRRTGFVAVPNVQYDAKLEEADYYQNIFHTHAYIRQHWSKYFKIRGILPGYIGNQDVVIVERRE